MTRLLLRITLFAVCVAAALYADSLLAALGAGDGARLRATAHASLQSLAWLAGAFAVIGVIDFFFWEGFVRRLARRPVPPLLKSVFAFVVLVLAVTGIVGVVFGRDVTAIWAASGAIGLVLGLALRDVIQDVFTGIAMNVDGSIKAGDWVRLHDADLGGEQYGRVIDIAWRASHIQLEDNNVLVVPHSLMGTIAVTNFANADHLSRLETEIVLDFDVPPERARRILLAGARAAAAARGVLAEPQPVVLVGEPTERGVTYKVRFWGRVTENSPSAMQDAVMTQLLRHLRVSGLTPAFPKEDVFFERRPKRLLDHERVADRMELLSRIDLFGKSLEPRELEQLATDTHAISWAAGEALVRQGEPGGSMFVVVEGALDVLVERGDGTGPVRVNQLAAGDIFGEMSLLTAEPRSATVVAGTGVVAYEVTRSHFEGLLANRPAIAGQISELVAGHRIRTDSAMRSAGASDVERETRMLSEQILERMRAVFGAFLRGPGSWQRDRAAG